MGTSFLSVAKRQLPRGKALNTRWQSVKYPWIEPLAAQRCLENLEADLGADPFPSQSNPTLCMGSAHGVGSFFLECWYGRIVSNTSVGAISSIVVSLSFCFKNAELRRN